MERQLCTRKCLFDNRDTTTMSLMSFRCLFNFGQIFALFLGTFIVDFEYYSFIVNATLQHIFVENKKGVILMRVVAKH